MKRLKRHKEFVRIPIEAPGLVPWVVHRPENLVGKIITISYWKDFPGEYARVFDIGDGKHKIVFEKCSDSDEDEIIWDDEQPDSVDERGAYFTNLGDIGNFYLKVEDKKLEYNQEQQTKQTQMKTTVKELAEKLDMEVAYINGFLQTLVKLGKAEVVGKVERPAGTRGKPSNIFEIADGIIDK